MISLKFNPYYTPLVFGTKEGEDFPFEDGEAVRMNFLFAYSVVIQEDEAKRSEVYQGIDKVKLIADFYPEVTRDTDYQAFCLVNRETAPTPLKVRTIEDSSSLLEAVLTTDDSEIKFPLQKYQTISVPLIVSRVELPVSDTWDAHLIPSGREVGGLIVAEVEPV